MDFEVRKVRKAQGPEAAARAEEYFRLMQLGYSNKEACQVVGINLRTGREWRNGRTSPNRTVAPALSPRTPRSTSSRYLREDERIHIADRLQEKAPSGPSQPSWAAARRPSAGRSAATAPRPRGQWHYRPHAAQARADARRWSPEQICHALHRKFPDRSEMHVTHETVYQALYVQGRGELRRELAKALRTGRARSPWWGVTLTTTIDTPSP